MQSKQLAMVAAWIWAAALVASPGAAQQPNSATLNGTIRSPLYGDHSWTLTLEGLSYSYHVAPSQYYGGLMTHVYANRFDFEFQGPRAAELNANVSEPLVSSELQDGPFVQLISFSYFDDDWDWWVQARDWVIEVKPNDYQQGLRFGSETSYGGEGGVFTTDTNGYPVLAPFTSFGAHTFVFDNRPDSGYSLGVWADVTVSVSSVGFSLPGDYNHNGTVDAADYAAWRKSPVSFGGNLSGYNTWRSYFGETTGATAAIGPAFSISVPEPSGLALIILVVSARVRRRKDRRTCNNLFWHCPARA
jgi:hypothetical protein